MKKPSYPWPSEVPGVTEEASYTTGRPGSHATNQRLHSPPGALKRTLGAEFALFPLFIRRPRWTEATNCGRAHHLSRGWQADWSGFNMLYNLFLLGTCPDPFRSILFWEPFWPSGKKPGIVPNHNRIFWQHLASNVLQTLHCLVSIYTLLFCLQAWWLRLLQSAILSAGAAAAVHKMPSTQIWQQITSSHHWPLSPLVPLVSTHSFLSNN